jgi:hypothetical protein
MYIFLELCSQAKLYTAIALLLLLYSVIKNPEHTRYDIAMLSIKAAVFIGWTFALNKLCTTGYKYIAWLGAIVPHLIYILFLINF